MSNAALFRRLLGTVMARPRLLRVLPALAWRFRRRDWYRRWPFLPLPSRTYVAWRMHTAFGDEAAAPTADQLDNYLRWAYDLTK